MARSSGVTARRPLRRRQISRWARVPLQLLTRDRRPGVTILMYHRVGGGTSRQLDLPAELFARQLDYLRRRYRIVSLDDLLDAAREQPPIGTRDLLVLTFDDGYAEMHSVVLPLLRRFNLPATLYLPTAYIEEQRPIDWGRYQELPAALRPRPLTWAQVRELQASGFFTIGAHTHTHLNLTAATPEEIEREIRQSNALLLERLGLRVRHFAYPYGRGSAGAREVVARFYETATVQGFLKIAFARLDPTHLPRVPVSTSDGFWFFRLRLSALPSRPRRHGNGNMPTGSREEDHE